MDIVNLFNFDLEKLDTIKDISSFKSIILSNEQLVIDKYINNLIEIERPKRTEDIIKCLLLQPELKEFINGGAYSDNVNKFVHKK